MRSGPMREWVTIEQSVRDKDSTGSPVLSWSIFARVPADVTPLSGSDRETYRLENAEVTTQFRIRYRAGLLPTMRVRWAGRVYRLTEVIDQTARRQEQVLLGYADAVR